jgi:cytochrome o ubiquinol oxidase subunit 2
MLIVVIPVIVLTLLFAWKYRASRWKAEYARKSLNTKALDAAMWLVPAFIVLALAVISWTMTHRLDPFRPIENKGKPLTIQVISLDWKWLFIYPDQKVAAVDEVAFPVNVPVHFFITSDTVMNSFFIPQLGSQIYAMAGMETKLNLEADETGKYLGENTQYSGDGFSHMRFDAMATTREDFYRWVATVRQSPETLDKDRLTEIEKPSARVPVEHFSSVTPKLFEAIISKYMSMGGDEPMPAAGQGADAGASGEDEVMLDFEFEFEGDFDARSAPPAGTDAAAAPEPSHPASKHNAIEEED